jgi:hypothetical protein
MIKYCGHCGYKVANKEIQSSPASKLLGKKHTVEIIPISPAVILPQAFQAEVFPMIDAPLFEMKSKLDQKYTRVHGSEARVMFVMSSNPQLIADHLEKDRKKVTILRTPALVEGWFTAGEKKYGVYEMPIEETKHA